MHVHFNVLIFVSPSLLTILGSNILKGCDASIIISSKQQGNKMLAEKDAPDNKDLREEGFESVRKAKAVVESKCPGVVSCADILAISARDYVHLVSAKDSLPLPSNL